MHTGVQKKNVSRANGRPAQRVGEEIFPARLCFVLERNGENMREKEQMYGFEMIHMEDIEDILKRERCMIIDLRGSESFRKNHYDGAKNFPFAYFDEWKNEIPEHISLILYCEHGNQSMLAARKLRNRRGNIYTVMGGYKG